MNRLKELRQEKGLTQQALADEIGVTKITILRWEKGDRQIKPEKAQQLADYFGVSVGYLLGFNEEKTTPFEQAGYIPTPREYASWEEFDYMQLGKTDLDFFVYHDLRKKLDPFRLELILNYSFCNDEDRELLRKVARKIAGKDSVTFKENK